MIRPTAPRPLAENLWLLAYGLAVALHAQLPDIAPDQAQRIMEEAHQTCPYSKALRGEASVALIVD